MRFDSLEAIVQGTAGNPVMKEVLDKLGDSNPNVFEVNCGVHQLKRKRLSIVLFPLY